MGRSQENRGGSHRVQRVEREIREVIATYLLGGFRGELPGFVSITRVMVTADLRTARGYITLMGGKDDSETQEAFEKRVKLERKEAVKELNAHAADFQHVLAQRLQMRYTPKLTFFYDDTYEETMRVQSVLNKISQSKAADAASANVGDDEDSVDEDFDDSDE